MHNIQKVGEMIKEDEEYTYRDEHWVMYRIAEACCTPEANVTAYTNYTGIWKGKKVTKLEFKSKSTYDVLEYNTTLSQLSGRNRD